MSWLVFAFSGPVLWAISVHLDKYLVERFFKQTDVAVLVMFTAFFGVLPLPFIWWFEPNIMTPGFAGIGLIALSGILYMGAMLFYLQALRDEEASVVAPFFQTSPLFAYVLAYLVLGETLSGMQMAGGAMIVAGTLIVSLNLGPCLPASARADGGRGAEPKRGRAFKLRLALLMLGCGFVLALATLIFKVSALQVKFWTTAFWMFVGEAAFGSGLLAIPSYRRQFTALLRENTAALLSINGANELINLGGGLGNRYALLLAPLSLVQAVGSTTTLFVFAFGVLVSLVAPRFGRETLSRRELAQKALAAAFVAAGVALVTR